MNKTYLVLAGILIILGLGLFVIEPRENIDEGTPGELFTDLGQNSKYITPDELASRIIEGDPSLQLIDVRDANDTVNISLPGAQIIPFPTLPNQTIGDLLELPGKDFVFYSNDDVDANKAWLILQQLGYSRLYILKGGLNTWNETIIKPQPPTETQPQEAFDLYQFRLGASQYFTGDNTIITPDAPALEIKFKRKKKKSAVEGGC